MVVVTVNYRLGALGYLYLPQLAAAPAGITRVDLAASHQCSFWLPLEPALGS